jgi:hypothetical protein
MYRSVRPKRVPRSERIAQMKTEKINFGCNVRDIDAKAATPAEFAELKDHLYRNRLIVLKDQP